VKLSLGRKPTNFSFAINLWWSRSRFWPYHWREGVTTNKRRIIHDPWPLGSLGIYEALASNEAKGSHEAKEAHGSCPWDPPGIPWYPPHGLPWVICATRRSSSCGRRSSFSRRRRFPLLEEEYLLLAEGEDILLLPQGSLLLPQQPDPGVLRTIILAIRKLSSPTIKRSFLQNAKRSLELQESDESCSRWRK